MTQDLYQELLGQEKIEEIKDFTSDSPTYSSFLEYSDFNETCYELMYLDQKNLENPETKLYFQDQIEDLESECSDCWNFYLNPRNEFEKGLDVQLGKKFEEALNEFLTNKLQSEGIVSTKADVEDKRLPDNCFVKDEEIIAFYEVKFHNAPFVKAHEYIDESRSCYEGSITLDKNKVKKQIEVVEKKETPTFFLHWVDFPCIEGIFYHDLETTKNYLEELNTYNRKTRSGDYKNGKKVGYTQKFYPPLTTMSTFEELLEKIKELDNDG